MRITTTRTALFAALAMVATLGTARAADEESGPLMIEKGFYGTLGGVAALDANDFGGAVDTDTGWGLDSRAGYRFHPNLAVEAQYQFVPRTEHHVVAGGRYKSSQHALTANGKLYIFSSVFQPYLLFGVGFVRQGFSDGPGKTAAAVRGGGGVQVFFTDNIGIYGEVTYLKPFTSLSDYNTAPIAFGGVFQF
jgi:hypothetical protein